MFYLYVKKKFTYLGIDETSLGINNKGLIIVSAETKNPELIKNKGYSTLKKAKDFLEDAKAYHRDFERLVFENIPELPHPTEMMASGMDNYYWLRVNNGRFSRQMIEHAGIAQVVTVNGYSPQRTVLYIDAFHGKEHETKEIIKEILYFEGFEIDKKNIEVVCGGDRSVPIINYADLLAFQIGLFLNEKYRKFFPERKKFPIYPHKQNYDKRRVQTLENSLRDVLSTFIKKE